MKRLPLLLLPVLVVFFLGSCSNLSLTARKYRPGFYFDRKDATHAFVKEDDPAPATHLPSAENAPQALAPEPGRPADVPDSTGPSRTTDTSATREGRARKVIAEVAPRAMQEPAAVAQGKDRDKPEREEYARARNAMLLATFSLLFFITAIIFAFLVPAVAILLGIAALTSCIFGWIMGLGVLSAHEKGEKFRGRGEALFAVIVGWVELSLLALSLVALVIAVALLYL